MRDFRRCFRSLTLPVFVACSVGDVSSRVSPVVVRSRCSSCWPPAWSRSAARRTVVGMLARGGHGGGGVVPRDAVGSSRRIAWDADRLGLALARLIVYQAARLADAPIEVVVDDTLFRRWGRRVFGVVLDPRRFRAGPQRARARQPVDHRRDRRSSCRSARIRCACRSCFGSGAARAPRPRCGWLAFR